MNIVPCFLFLEEVMHVFGLVKNILDYENMFTTQFIKGQQGYKV